MNIINEDAWKQYSDTFLIRRTCVWFSGWKGQTRLGGLNKENFKIRKTIIVLLDTQFYLCSTMYYYNAISETVLFYLWGKTKYTYLILNWEKAQPFAQCASCVRGQSCALFTPMLPHINSCWVYAWSTAKLDAHTHFYSSFVK